VAGARGNHLASGCPVAAEWARSQSGAGRAAATCPWGAGTLVCGEKGHPRPPRPRATACVEGLVPRRWGGGTEAYGGFCQGRAPQNGRSGAAELQLWLRRYSEGVWEPVHAVRDGGKKTLLKSVREPLWRMGYRPANGRCACRAATSTVSSWRNPRYREDVFSVGACGSWPGLRSEFRRRRVNH